MTVALLGVALVAFAPAPPPAKRLAIVNPALHQYEGGPNVPSSYVYSAGDTVFLSFQIGGYRASEKERVLISYRVEALDPRGLALAPAEAGKVDVELADEDKNWMPTVHYSVLVPPSAGSGAYKIQIRLKDEIGRTEAAGEVTFAVRGLAVEPSPALVLRNFRFLRGEEDGAPLAAAVYRPGDAVWARFEITGYKLGEKNRYHVEYGVAVLRPSGEVLYSEPNAASEKEESFYPRRYVLGALSLKLDSTIAKGEYTIVVTARDVTGGQTSETRQVFRVE